MISKKQHDESRKGPIWFPYVGKEVVVYLNGGSIYGVLNRPNIQEGYVDFCPSIVYEVDEKTAYLEKKLPTSISLSYFQQGREVVIRPLKEGYLESKVKLINEQLKSREGIGFNLNSNKSH